MTRTEHEIKALEAFASRHGITAWQAEVVLEAVRVVISSHCWKTDTELEDMIDAFTRECRDYEDEQFQKRQAEKAAA